MITTQFDDFLQERYELKPRWEVVLSNGTKVYQDDERLGYPSWKALQQYIEGNNDVYIKEMYFGCRDNVVYLPSNAEGYLFKFGLLATYNWSKSSFIVGTVKDDKCIVWKYDLPEMVFLGEEIRELEEERYNVIWQKNKLPPSILPT